jgi:hypothetical protein
MTIHVYFVLDGTTVEGKAVAGVTINDKPLQIVATCAGITGLGLTITFAINEDPLQPAADGVTVYVIS